MRNFRTEPFSSPCHVCGSTERRNTYPHGCKGCFKKEKQAIAARVKKRQESAILADEARQSLDRGGGVSGFFQSARDQKIRDIHNRIVSLLDADIKLIRDTHQYVLASNKTLKFRNVTSVIAKHFEPFHARQIATRLVSISAKYSRRYTVDELVAKWESEAETGTLVHSELQKYIEDGKKPKSIIGKRGARWFDTHILGPSTRYDSEYYCEVRLFHEELGLAGTVDLLVHDKKSGNCYILDWKTSKKIERRGYEGKKGTTSATRTLPDCRYSKYALQMTLYRYILEKKFQIPIKASYIIHVPRRASASRRKLGKAHVQLIKARYLRANAERILAML